MTPTATWLLRAPIALAAAYNYDRINPEWKAYIDLPWYQQLWVPTPHMWRPGFEPGQPTTTASVRG